MIESKQPHYNNTDGSLYLWFDSLGLNNWEFDICKRIVRSRKKGCFKQDLEKSIDLIELYKAEYPYSDNQVWTTRGWWGIVDEVALKRGLNQFEMDVVCSVIVCRCTEKYFFDSLDGMIEMIKEELNKY